MLGGAVAAWMLYIQHQYEDTYYRRPEEWSFELSALQGSSYLRLPRPLTWAVGNANYHHVHHLSARIPNYRLRAAHEEQPMFARTPVITPAQQPGDAAAEALGRGGRPPRPLPLGPLETPRGPRPARARPRRSAGGAPAPRRAAPPSSPRRPVATVATKASGIGSGSSSGGQTCQWVR